MDLKKPLIIMYFFIILFLLFYLVLYINSLRKVKTKKWDNLREINDVCRRFKIDKRKINYKKEIKYIALINSFIIASVGTFVTCLDLPIYIQLGISFIMLLGLIYALYEIYGRHLEKKVRRNEK